MPKKKKRRQRDKNKPEAAACKDKHDSSRMSQRATNTAPHSKSLGCRRGTPEAGDTCKPLHTISGFRVHRVCHVSSNKPKLLARKLTKALSLLATAKRLLPRCLWLVSGKQLKAGARLLTGAPECCWRIEKTTAAQLNMLMESQWRDFTQERPAS